MTDADLLDRVRRRLAGDPVEVTPASIAGAVRAECGGRPIEGGVALLERLQDDLLGAGVLAPLLRDPTVTDVLVNAPDEVWVDRGGRVERADIAFADDAHVAAVLGRVLGPLGVRLDRAHPWADAVLPGGVRVHALLPPLAAHPVVTLRRVPPVVPSWDDLAAWATVP